MAEPESTNTMLQNAFVKIGDGNYALKTQGAGGGSGGTVSLDPAGNTVKIDQTGANNATQSLLPTAARVNSTCANGKVTAPAAAAAICTTASLAVGTWDVEAIAFIGGTTVAATEVDNIELRLGASKITTVIVPVPGTAGANANGSVRVRIQVGTAAAVSLNATAAATASSIYVGQITATRVM